MIFGHKNKKLGRPRKLNEVQIYCVKCMNKNGLSLRALAKIYKVSRMCIFRAVKYDGGKNE
ncbi:MAG: helix-turn-helix domain-containing protein [Candidatus Parvarchaeota archaeon]|nr:helix-turn-helix domain-containing protein [Candidatus Jingweiarchaeum tengchongense]MCW1298315.1 helix-turn-helix domain-containing protein [Candidatus Jingweiarchaeum tengchongense]MCW1300406.1 helix-turn-helix domain-containing protein [Candidatus Jingweiarchaeum tengchongense]MCW1304749.1 helix-turn-helix domain-containing protein [Candidatus Jingweiarchaeum tengchongense]MCW1305339.1 helix-turn-helix domain-containing protein [Candidatus Jingweiarchaeum tengchongense]